MGGIAQLLMTEAYRHAPSVIAPFDYTGMVWAIVIGFIVFDQFPTVQVLIGTAICGSGLFILHREITLGEEAQGEAHQPLRGMGPAGLIQA